MQRASEIVAVAPPRREAGPPRRRHNLPDRAWGASLGVLGATVLVVALLIVAELWRLARPYLATTGLARFVTTSQWDVVRETYGAFPFVYGTLVTSAADAAGFWLYAKPMRVIQSQLIVCGVPSLHCVESASRVLRCRGRRAQERCRFFLVRKIGDAFFSRNDFLR